MKIWLQCDFCFRFAFTRPVILGVKFVTESNSQFFKLESDRRDLSLFVIIFMNENDCSHLYVAPKRQALLWANALIFGRCSHDNDRQKPIISDALGKEESSPNFIFNSEFAFSAISSISILLGILECYAKWKWIYKCKQAVFFRKITATTIKDLL